MKKSLLIAMLFVSTAVFAGETTPAAAPTIAPNKTIEQRIEENKTEQKKLVDQYNKDAEQMQGIKERLFELQGALKTLVELKNVDPIITLQADNDPDKGDSLGKIGTK